MTSSLFAGWNTDRVGTMTCLLTTSIVTNATVTIPAGKYSHVDMSSVMGTGLYDDLATALQTALFAASPLEDFSVTFSASTRLYTITNAGAPMTLIMTSAAGQRLAKALGLTASNSLGSGSGYACTITSTTQDIVSNVLPYYIVPLQRDSPMRYTRPYHPDGNVGRALTVNGNSYSVTPLTHATLIDMTLQFLPVANVFADDAAAAQPWTIEHWFAHCGGTEPTLVSYADLGSSRPVIKLRENEIWTRDRRENVFVRGDYQGVWHVPLKGVQRLGRM